MDNKELSYLGLAAKAGKIASGEFSTKKAITSGVAQLVLVANDASDNTKKLFKNSSEFYKVPMYIVGSKEELGHCIGKAQRSSLAVLDKGFSEALIQLFNK